MASPQLRADMIRAYQQDNEEIRTFLAKYEDRDTNFENMRSDYDTLGMHWQDLIPNITNQEADELFSDEGVVEVQDQYNDLIRAATVLYQEREDEVRA